MQVPTAARLMNDEEWEILQHVYAGSLPSRYRIMLTNGLGGGERPFSIPTSALSVLSIPAAVQAAYSGFVTAHLGKFGQGIAKAMNATGFIGALALPSQVSGLINLGYIVSVGPAAFPDMTQGHKALMVHELAHVWQGSNSASSMTYVNNSIMNQCRAESATSGHAAAYEYTPGQAWRSYGAEQQASIIEDWYGRGMPQTGDLWPYIRDFVRKGIV